MNLLENAQKNQTKKLIAEWLAANGLTLVREPSTYQDGSAEMRRGPLRLSVDFVANHTGVSNTHWSVQFLFDPEDHHPVATLRGHGYPPDDVWEQALKELDQQMLETRRHMAAIEAAYAAACKEINP